VTEQTVAIIKGLEVTYFLKPSQYSPLAALPSRPGDHGRSLQHSFSRADGIEGREHSWITGVYWTLAVMSTLVSETLPLRATLAARFRSSSSFPAW
jgi:hypothetical protein